MTRVINTACCIAGGGPAGMMLGYLLARSGVQVAVLEKHGDFLRDFRGDTLHPSTLLLMQELGLLDEFLTLPHDRIDHMDGRFGSRRIHMVDLRRVHTPHRYIAFMPQWDFLDFLARKGRGLPEGFRPSKVVFAILLKDGTDLTADTLFPFSQVTLVQTARTLEAWGVEVEVVGIASAPSAVTSDRHRRLVV